ncbi:MAG: hypothetical protein M3Y93_05840 [Pseudomonadota bacterium]|nr:hypothetical protein [Pseudomonadota bacterium]
MNAKANRLLRDRAFRRRVLFSRILGNAMIRSLAHASGSSSTLRPRLFRNAAGSPQGKVYIAGTDQRDARDILATQPGVLEFTRYASRR